MFTHKETSGDLEQHVPSTKAFTLSALELRESALAARVDERTLRRYLDGEVVRPMCAGRIQRVLKAHFASKGGAK